MSGPRIVTTRSEQETAAAAAAFAAGLAPGSVVLLYGELGAGKTAFVRGMAAGLGLDPDDVSSPTFTIIQEYRQAAAASAGAGRARMLYHVDLYRLEGAEIDDLGLEELTAGGGIAAIEWADKLTRAPAGSITVRITENAEEGRLVEIRPA